MITFQKFFESSDSLILTPHSDMSLQEFLKTLEGSTIQEILDKSSYINLYMGNKYGFKDLDDKYRNTKEFANAFVAFVNKDVLKHRPSEYGNRNNYRRGI